MTTLAYFFPLLAYGFAGAFLLFFLLWLVQVVIKDAGVVDIGWTTGVGAMAVCAAVIGDGWMPRRILLGSMGGLWALRLVLYILMNRVVGGEEDSRYQRLRAHWGAHANRWFFVFFTSQSLLVVLFALPFLPGAAKGTATWMWSDTAAAAVWILAMGGEWLADFQLARFRGNPRHRGKVCRDGLWGWSRHPNYFFEWLHWFAYVFLAVGAGCFTLSLIGPAAMYLFLVRLTGIPHVEREALAKRGDAYREYQRTTSMLFPLPPRKCT